MLQVSKEGRKEGRKKGNSYWVEKEFVRRYRQGIVECLSGICVAIGVTIVVKDRNDVVTHKCVVLVVVGERHESLQKMLPMNEVGGCLSESTRRCRHSQRYARTAYWCDKAIATVNDTSAQLWRETAIAAINDTPAQLPGTIKP